MRSFRDLKVDRWFQQAGARSTRCLSEVDGQVAPHLKPSFRCGPGQHCDVLRKQRAFTRSALVNRGRSISCSRATAVMREPLRTGCLYVQAAHVDYLQALGFPAAKARSGCLTNPRSEHRHRVESAFCLNPTLHLFTTITTNNRGHI